MHPKTMAVLGAAFGLTACLSTTDPNERQQNYGFVILEAEQDLETYALTPTALFYRTGLLQLPSTNTATDTCFIAPFFEDGSEGNFPPSISAGESIELTLSGGTAVLTPRALLGRTEYRMSEGMTLPYIPGDTVTVEIPGAADGFPAWTLKARTAEAFTHVPTPEGLDTEVLPLRWDAAPRPGSKMLVSLRYPTAEGMEQIYCELIDDGAYDVGAQRAQGWRLANPEGREEAWSRWRITGEQNGGSILLVLSTFEVPTPQVVQ